MAFSLMRKDKSIPVGKIRNTDKIIYFIPKNTLGLESTIKQYKSDPHVCRYCDKKLASAYSLKLHYNTCKTKKQQEQLGESGVSNQMEFPEKDKKGYGKYINLPIFSLEKNRETNRDIVYICGKNGSGKSYYVADYVEMYIKMYPNDRIILLTRLQEDTTFTERGIEKDIHRVVVSDKILEDRFELSDFEHSLVIMDDIDSSLNSILLKKYLYKLRDDLIENGRHHKINMLITSHAITNYKDTRSVLNECSCVVIYPNINIPRQINYLLKSYLMLNENQRKRIFNLPSRWVAINVRFQYVSYQHGIYSLQDE